MAFRDVSAVACLSSSIPSAISLSAGNHALVLFCRGSQFFDLYLITSLRRGLIKRPHLESITAGSLGYQREFLLLSDPKHVSFDKLFAIRVKGRKSDIYATLISEDEDVLTRGKSKRVGMRFARHQLSFNRLARFKPLSLVFIRH